MRAEMEELRDEFLKKLKESGEKRE
jgi:hypothetical protein